MPPAAAADLGPDMPTKPPNPANPNAAPGQSKPDLGSPVKVTENIVDVLPPGKPHAKPVVVEKQTSVVDAAGSSPPALPLPTPPPNQIVQYQQVSTTVSETRYLPKGPPMPPAPVPTPWLHHSKHCDKGQVGPPCVPIAVPIVAGIIVLLLVLLVCCCIFLLRRRRKRQNEVAAQYETDLEARRPLVQSSPQPSPYQQPYQQPFSASSSEHGGEGIFGERLSEAPYRPTSPALSDSGTYGTDTNRMALAQYLEEANKGDARAQHALGLIYQRAGNYSEAMLWFTRAADQGRVKSKYKLAQLCELGGNGVEQDLRRALSLYTEAANEGHSGAQNELGLMYLRGKAVNTDAAQAAKWFRQAAEQGEVCSQCNLGCLYLYGRGVEQNCIEAIAWLKRAAEQRLVQSYRDLAVAYCGVADHKKALRWFQQAALQGDTYATYAEGVLTFNGQGTMPNPQEGLRLMLQAASKGDEHAQDAIATFSGERCPHGVEIRRWKADLADMFSERGAASLLSLVDPEVPLVLQNPTMMEAH